MKHIVFYSGGLGSYGAARRVFKKRGKENVDLLFTDTLIEDNDLYRFLIETAGKFYEVEYELIQPLLFEALNLTEIYVNEDLRKEEIYQLREKATKLLPQLIWIIDGRTPWDLFFERNYLSNAHLAHCSHILKQDASEEYIKSNYEPQEVTLYLGIDWTEEHRVRAPKANWRPYNVLFPMCNTPLHTSINTVRILDTKEKITPPRIYSMGGVHNNCGNFCVRAGVGSFINLLETNPALYLYHERKEQEIAEHIGKDVSIIQRKRGGKKKKNYTLKEIREDWENDNNVDIDVNDIGGCGCFVTYNENEEEQIE